MLLVNPSYESIMILRKSPSFHRGRHVSSKGNHNVNSLGQLVRKRRTLTVHIHDITPFLKMYGNINLFEDNLAKHSNIITAYDNLICIFQSNDK